MLVHDDHDYHDYHDAHDAHDLIASNLFWGASLEEDAIQVSATFEK